MTWALERHRGDAAALHALEPPATRAVWVMEPTRPAIVVGSAQRGDVQPPPGVDVVRRRSGGGAVWVAPTGCLWVDVVVPRDDELWDDDVGRGALWLGRVWAQALGGAAVVHEGPMRRTPWSATFCFSGAAAGEVTRGDGGPKLVGISQRRTRTEARFQCVTYERWSAEPLATAVGVPWDEVGTAGADAGDLAALERAFLAALTAS